MIMERHFVTFYSPGTFVVEMTERPIDSWDVDAAIAMAAEIVERYNARPYGFRFSTRTREEDDLDSKVSATSPMHYFAGTISTLEEVKARDLPDEKILRSNMECNGYDRIITTETPWKWTQPLEPEDIVLAVPSPRALETQERSE